jgi:hypothetical protein
MATDFTIRIMDFQFTRGIHDITTITTRHTTIEPITLMIQALQELPHCSALALP